MKNRVLISCVGNKVSLVKAFQQSGWYVIGTDRTDDIAGKFFCDEFHQYDFTEFIDRIPFDVDLIVPTYDGELMQWANSEIDPPVMVATPSTVFACVNKKVFHDFANNKYYNYRQAERMIQTNRLFLQGLSNTGGSKTSHLLKSKEDLRYWHRYYNGNVVIFDYCDWYEYTIDLFADFDGNVLSVVPREREVIRGGESWVGRIDMNPLLIDAASALATDLNLIGHNTLQCFFDGKDVRWIEVNARYGGGFPLAYAAGMDTPGMLLDIINGEEPRKVIIQDGMKMHRYTENIFV